MQSAGIKRFESALPLSLTAAREPGRLGIRDEVLAVRRRPEKVDLLTPDLIAQIHGINAGVDMLCLRMAGDMQGQCLSVMIDRDVRAAPKSTGDPGACAPPPAKLSMIRPIR
ncbi:MAG: hypothetical protein AAGF50_08500 [Pseudomonadota bacterium]